MKSLIGRSLATLWFATVLTCPIVASAKDEVKAAALAREADDLLAANKIDEACAKLSESLQLDPRSTTALELGRCRSEQKRPGSAYRAYALAESLAKDEKRNDRVRTAQAKKNPLAFRIAKLKVDVAAETKGLEGLVIRVDDEVLPPESYGKNWEADPRELTIEASAPGYEPFTTKVTLTARQQKAIEVPALTKSAAPAPVPAKPEDKPEEEPTEVPPEPQDDTEEPEDTGPPADEHEEMRLVVEVGALGGFLYSDLSTGGVSSLLGVNYQYFIDPLTQRNVACGNTTVVPGAGECDAVMTAEIGGTVGGQLMIGLAVTPRVHVGVRGMFQARLPEGFIAGAGPTISGRVAGPLWLGASFLLGGEHHRSDVERVTGSLPEDARAFNGDQETIDISLDDVPFRRDDVESGLLLGGQLELSIALLGPSPHALLPLGEPRGFFSGALYLGVFPTIMGFSPGWVLNVPAGLSYRFH